MPAEKRNFTSTEIKAGVMVLVSVAVLAGFVGAIRGCGSGRVEMNRFHTQFTSINGLNLAADVRFGGVKVGKVVNIGTDPDDRAQIRVLFEVPETVPVNRGSVATIDQVSLTTGKHLEISTGGSEEPLHTSGDLIASISSAGGMFDLPQLEGVITRLETMLDGLILLLGAETAQELADTTGGEVVDLATIAASLDLILREGTETVQNIDATISENRDGLAEIVERLSALEKAAIELLDNLNAAVEENRPPLNATMVNFEQVSDEASRQLKELTESLKVTLEYLQEVSGNASDLVEDQRPTLEQTLINLEATTRNLKKFSEALAEQPNALVRGAKPQGRTDGGE